MKKKWILVMFVFILIINLSSVMAADFLSPIMNVFKGLDLGAYVTNPQYYPFIDAVIYLILFIGISTFALGKVFGESKIVPITVGVILALSMAGFEYMTKWRLMMALSMYAWILVLLIFGFFLYYLMNKVTNNFWFPFAIAVFLVGGLLTTNAAVSEQVRQNETLSGVIGLTQTVAFFGLIGSSVSLFKRKNDGPNASETADLSTYFPKGKTAADRIEDVEKDVESNTKDKGEKELLESMEEDTKLIEDSEVPIAEGKKTADALETEKKVEETKNMNEEQIMNALTNDSETINNALNKAGAPNVDAVLPAYITNYLRRVTQIGEALGQNQKKAITARIDLLNSTLDNVKKIDDILKKSKKLDNNLSYIEKKVAKDMGQEVLAHIREELKKRYFAMNRSKKAFSDQIAKAKAENNPQQINLIIENQKKTISDFKKSIQTAEINKAHVENTINIFIKQYTAVVTKTITDIKKIISDQMTFEQDLKKKVGNAYTDAQKYSVYMDRLDGAISKINGQIVRIQKEDSSGNGIVEDIIAEANAGIADMFLELSNINNHTTTLFQNDILPLLDDFKRLDVQSAQLGISINELNKSSLQIQKSYEDLKRAVSFDKTGQSANIEKILMAINTLSNTASQERQQVINQTISQMDKTKADIQNELNKMVQENQHLNDKQRRVMESLDKAMATLAKIRIDQMNKVEQATTKINTVAAQATQNLEHANAGLENVMFKK